MLSRVLEPEVMDEATEAAEYDAMNNDAPNAAVVARLVELGAGGWMLDIGTGPGHIPVLVCAAIPGARVVGVDLSAPMLVHAERRRAASPFADRIELRVANATGLDFPDAAFDAVYSNTILHHLPDPLPFVREAWRVLRPGGALLIRDLFRPENETTLARLTTLYCADCTPRQRRQFADSLKAALTPDETRALLAEAGMPGAEVTIDSDRHVSIQKRATA
jgi:ubiquinone/menaquinone biosynthesis C-methylase UbiE